MAWVAISAQELVEAGCRRSVGSTAGQRVNVDLSGGHALPHESSRSCPARDGRCTSSAMRGFWPEQQYQWAWAPAPGLRRGLGSAMRTVPLTGLSCGHDSRSTFRRQRPVWRCSAAIHSTLQNIRCGGTGCRGRASNYSRACGCAAGRDDGDS